MTRLAEANSNSEHDMMSKLGRVTYHDSILYL